MQPSQNLTIISIWKLRLFLACPVHACYGAWPWSGKYTFEGWGYSARFRGLKSPFVLVPYRLDNNPNLKIDSTYKICYPYNSHQTFPHTLAPESADSECLVFLWSLPASYSHQNADCGYKMSCFSREYLKYPGAKKYSIWRLILFRGCFVFLLSPQRSPGNNPHLKLDGIYRMPCFVLGSPMKYKNHPFEA